MMTAKTFCAYLGLGGHGFYHRGGKLCYVIGRTFRNTYIQEEFVVPGVPERREQFFKTFEVQGFPGILHAQTEEEMQAVLPQWLCLLRSKTYALFFLRMLNQTQTSVRTSPLYWYKTCVMRDDRTSLPFNHYRPWYNRMEPKRAVHATSMYDAACMAFFDHFLYEKDGLLLKSRDEIIIVLHYLVPDPEHPEVFAPREQNVVRFLRGYERYAIEVVPTEEPGELPVLCWFPEQESL